MAALALQEFSQLREARRDEPLVLRRAAYSSSQSFTLASLEQALDVRLPLESAAKQGGDAERCTLLVADQEKEEVMAARPAVWAPGGCSFQKLAQKIKAPVCIQIEILISTVLLRCEMMAGMCFRILQGGRDVHR